MDKNVFCLDFRNGNRHFSIDEIKFVSLEIWIIFLMIYIQRRSIMSILVIITYILDFPYLSQKFWITISPIDHHLCFSLHVALSLSLSIKQIKEYFIFDWLFCLIDFNANTGRTPLSQQQKRDHAFCTFIPQTMMRLKDGRAQVGAKNT